MPICDFKGCPRVKVFALLGVLQERQACCIQWPSPSPSLGLSLSLAVACFPIGGESTRKRAESGSAAEKRRKNNNKRNQTAWQHRVSPRRRCSHRNSNSKSKSNNYSYKDAKAVEWKPTRMRRPVARSCCCTTNTAAVADVAASSMHQPSNQQQPASTSVHNSCLHNHGANSFNWFSMWRSTICLPGRTGLSRAYFVRLLNMALTIISARSHWDLRESDKPVS